MVTDDVRAAAFRKFCLTEDIAIEHIDARLAAELQLALLTIKEIFVTGYPGTCHDVVPWFGDNLSSAFSAEIRARGITVHRIKPTFHFQWPELVLDKTEMDQVRSQILSATARLKFKHVESLKKLADFTEVVRAEQIERADSLRTTESAFDPYSPQRHKKGRKSHLGAAINQNIHNHPAMAWVWYPLIIIILFFSLAMMFFK